MANAPDHNATTAGAAGYWSESRRPLSSLIFVAPLLLVYEAGLILMGPNAVRNGAEVWLRCFLDAIGLGQYLLLPILTVGTLLGWHYTTRQPWRVSPGIFSGMAVESMLLALCLRLLLYVQGVLLQVATPLARLSEGQDFFSGVAQAIRTAVAYLGAGIYEELLFRLVLLSLVIGAMRAAGAPRRLGLLVAIVCTSLLFSAAHYIGASGETVRWFSFAFRFLAGTFFAVIYVYRGFGIVVGAHAGYDILVGLF